MTKRRICVVVQSRANYARIKSVLRAIDDHPGLELQLVLGASALLDRFGDLRDIIASEGFTPSATVYSIVEGETPGTMAKSTGLGIIELATQFENLKPDVVLTVADRFETMATAIAASYMNIPLAHTQGGETTGSIDESVRHSITKLAHLHFPATSRAHDYLLRMGEEADRVHLTGCPAMDLLESIDLRLPDGFFEGYAGVGPDLSEAEPYVVVLQHPVTTEYGEGYEQVGATLDAVRRLKMQTVWLWPNIDAGSDQVSKRLRIFREQNPNEAFHFYKNFSPEDYARLIANCRCLIGNSSSALREGSFLGVPAVNIGSRQSGREHAANVIHASYDADEIETAARKQIAVGKHPRSHLFGDGTAGRQIAEILGQAPLSIRKRLSYLDEEDGVVAEMADLS